MSRTEVRLKIKFDSNAIWSNQSLLLHKDERLISPRRCFLMQFKGIMVFKNTLGGQHWNKKNHISRMRL